MYETRGVHPRTESAYLRNVNPHKKVLGIVMSVAPSIRIASRKSRVQRDFKVLSVRQIRRRKGFPSVRQIRKEKYLSYTELEESRPLYESRKEW